MADRLHIWLRAEERDDERRTPLTPAGAAELHAAGVAVTVEDSPARVFPTSEFAAAGCGIRPAGSWRGAPADAIVLGLKELADDGAALRHRHVMFGHAYKGQPAGRRLLDRLVAGGGALLDLEVLTDAEGRRLAAFGHWAGYVGAGLAVAAVAAQAAGQKLGPLAPARGAATFREDLARRLGEAGPLPDALVVGALGRVGGGAVALFSELGIAATGWDMVETAHGGPFPEVLAHVILVNAIVALPGAPVLVPATATGVPRRLTVIADVACDPESDFSPIRVNDRPTSWAEPVRRVHARPPLDVIAIDNLPSLLPRESSEDFASQLLPHLKALSRPDSGAWGRALAAFRRHAAARSG